MNCVRIFAAVSAASLLMGCMGVSGSSEATSERNVGEASAAIQLFNVRSGPGFAYPVVYTLPPGVSLNIQCSTSDPSGNTWYQLEDGNYILAAVTEGSETYPECAAAGESL